MYEQQSSGETWAARVDRDETSAEFIDAIL